MSPSSAGGDGEQLRCGCAGVRRGPLDFKIGVFIMIKSRRVVSPLGGSSVSTLRRTSSSSRQTVSPDSEVVRACKTPICAGACCPLIVANRRLYS